MLLSINFVFNIIEFTSSFILNFTDNLTFLWDEFFIFFKNIRFNTDIISEKIKEKIGELGIDDEIASIQLVDKKGDIQI
jgi:hypothetical protein